jgi:hypothetical protein
MKSTAKIVGAHGGGRAASSVALLGSVAVCLMLVGVAAVASAATTTTTTAANPFPISTSAPSYTGTTTIVVNGSLPSGLSQSEVSVTITNPKNVALVAENAAVQENSTFSAAFQVSYETGWNTTGQYTVTAVDVIPDYVGPMPTSVIYFNYTAVPPISTSTSTTSSATTAVTTTSPPLSLGSILPIVAAIVIVVALMGFLLTRRGRRRPSTSARPAATAPK